MRCANKAAKTGSVPHPGWGRRQSQVRTWTAPVSQWLVQAISPQPGQRVLELAAGPGETGFSAAKLIQPGGTLVCSDQSEAMLRMARGRAAELGLDNVEFKPIDAESGPTPRRRASTASSAAGGTC